MLSGEITVSEADEKQSNLLKNILEFNDKARPKSKADKKEKNHTCKSVNALYESRELTLNAFQSRTFPINPTQGKRRPSDLPHVAKVSDCFRLKIQTPKQTLQGLPIALAQVKADNISENLLYSLYQAKEITKKVYHNIINSIKF